MSVAPIEPLPAIMTNEEAAEALRCSVNTVERYVHRHLLTAIQIGKERRFRAEDVLEFVASQPPTHHGGRGKRK